MINSSIKKIRRIGIDARFYGPLGTGIGRYIQEVVDNVIKIDRENEYVIFLSRENFDEFVPTEARIKKVAVNARWYSLAEQIFMPWLIARERLDLMHFAHFNVPILTPVKFVVTIHDLILTKFPTVRASTLSPWLYKIKNFFYQIVIALAVKRARKVIAVSEFTKKDIIGKFKIKPDKIAVTYEGVANLARGNDSLFVKKLDDSQTLLSYNIADNFLLYAGNAYPHKNLEVLLEVFAELRKKHPALRLVLAGKEDYFYQRLKATAARLNLWHDAVPDGPVIFTGYVPDVELEVLYRRALFYVFPSLYEGFGLPALEAMAKGCPVASSDKSCLPEILGDAALYFDPTDKADMFIKMDQLYSDEDLRQVLIKKGHRQVKRYNWWECARLTLEVYRSVLI
ncbi:MAG TPA: glycosyltransferase family 1 protein [Candidatus Nanoarchaeia archaeon]|nr:glycosyltransferase family 1 protein [Candidatus Nanoarchaeia archaeon]